MSSKSPTGIAPVLQVHPLRRCNLACAHCYTSSSPHAVDELRVAMLAGCLEDAARLGYRQLAVSGGEPLLYKPLGEILSLARSLGMITSLTSNGMLATSARWKPLAPLIDVTAISIDGTPEEHDAIRRRQGAFASTIGNLKIVRASGVPFGFIFTLTQHNVDSLDYVVRLAAEHGARSVQVHPLALHGRAVDELPDARPDAIELRTALFEAERLGRALDVAVHVDAVSIEQLQAYRDHLVPAQPVRRLVDVAPVLVVEADATVMPLTHEISRDLALGSLADGRLEALAQHWIASRRGENLAAACARTWSDLANSGDTSAVYWYEEVAARTRQIVMKRSRATESRTALAT